MALRDAPDEGTRELYEQGMILRVANAPKTPIRGFRCPDEDWLEFQRCCEADGEAVSVVLRRLIREYNRKRRRVQQRDK